jgi:tetratricopeptide (TPR) repeat protein
MRKPIVCLIVIFFFSSAVFSQESKELQEKFLEGEYFLMNEAYVDALNLYLPLYEDLPDNANLAHSIGICYLNIQGRKNLAIDYLESAVRNMSPRHKEGTIRQVESTYEALYDLARAYRINYMFDKARETYERYAGTLLPDDKVNRDFIDHEIKVCQTAKELIAKPVEYIEENMGEMFNDENSDFNPVISGDGKTFAWMVSLKFYDAVMVSRQVNGKWSAPVNITPELQSDGDYYISSLSSDGKTLFMSRNDNFNSDIWFSTFDGNSWAKAARLSKNINSRYWESHAFISDDGTRLYFTSDRPGGFGGLDIYVSIRLNGDWGPGVNLGPEINTQFNDDRPFLVNGGKTLFFSSQGHETIGGYDIFKSDLQPNKLWSKPVNLGYPLNTPDDNFFFNPIGTGKSGYYSVFRETGGFGKEDIYKINLQ